MTFISLEFLIFFIIVTSLYFAIPHKYRWVLLLIASCLFYISIIPVYIFVLFALITIDFFAGKWISGSKGLKRKAFLILSIASTISVLFVFKYFNFFSANFEELANLFYWKYSARVLKFALPVGLSFHTFQSLAYVIEVYRGRQKVERNYGIYALYVMFYPQLMAGPIERPYNMLHQFLEKHKFDYDRVVSGLRLMLWGAFQKVVIADRAAQVVNIVYKNPTHYSGLSLVVATVLFAFQIFCDFAGYSNIAIGAARVMGFKLMKNFNGPYFASSIRDFWRRWHISLSTWFRDYLYIPLGGSRSSKPKVVFNIMVTFLVSGLWHGANWTFVVWGALHGFFLLTFDRIWDFLKLPKVVRIVITFSLVTFAWIFFRADTLKDAFYIAGHLFNQFGSDLNTLLSVDFGTFARLMTQNSKVLGLTIFGWIDLVGAIIAMSLIEFARGQKNIQLIFNRKPLVIRWLVYYILILIIISFTTKGMEQFIYFQF